MDLAELKKQFFGKIAKDPPNEWEIEEYLSLLLVMPKDQQMAILDQVPAIWPVSHALCYNYLSQAKDCLACLEPAQLQEWVVGLLDAYEAAGLRGAQQYITDIEKNFLCRIRGENGIMLEKVKKRLQVFIQGVTGECLEISPAAHPSTDGQTLFLPPEVNGFSVDQQNYLLYKFMAAFQAGHLVLRTYGMNIAPTDPFIRRVSQLYNTSWPSDKDPLSSYFALFPDTNLIQDIFQVVQSHRIFSWLAEKLPGLCSDLQVIGSAVVGRSHGHEKRTKNNVVVRLQRDFMRFWLIENGSPASTDFVLHKALKLLTGKKELHYRLPDPLVIAADIYRIIKEYPGEYQSTIHPFIGTLIPKEAHKVRLMRRQADKQKFIEAFGALAVSRQKQQEGIDQDHHQQAGLTQTLEEDGLLVTFSSGGKAEREQQSDETGSTMILQVGNEEIRVPEDMRTLVDRISNDLGGVPQVYISSAVGQAGHGLSPSSGPPDNGEQPLSGVLVYDEWDYRRSNYRKNWCHLHEKKIEPVGGNFVSNTIDKYNGLLIKLRRQFEMMRLQERYVKKQKEGDDIDLDAVIEFLGDKISGCSSDERFYTRLARDERDIAVVFLVDMSSSTEGWINTALKEALLLIGESLAILGDRFAIYGFSGMRRLRSELFLIKKFDEQFTDHIKGKIAAISPQDYTRMGPPIRHVTQILSETDARVRLLITLSDGKPEDYDDYKGEYAIEDTRHALIEAKALGIHPFCITIDQQAHDYMAHMYGEVNYIFLNDVRQLPSRMPAIYRGLTS
jgi:nitric oxide reductase NorD protein